MAMAPDELDEYASIIGLNTKGMDKVAEKVSAITSKRETTCEMVLLGAVFSIPVRNVHDKRFQDAISGIMSDEKAETAARLVLGDEQWERLIQHVTDDDGVIDIDALGLAVSKIINNPELKNY